MNVKIFDEKKSTDEVILLLSELAKRRKYVFRGYSKQDELFPGLIRDENNYDENSLLRDFERYGGHYFHANSPIEFMSCAQHFGLPTRLLDFTHNPFIALSFALYGKKGTKYKNREDIDYYYIRYADIYNNISVSTIPLENTLSFRSLDTGSIAEKAIDIISRCEKIMNSPNANTEKDLEIVSTTSFSSHTIHNLLDEGVILFVDPNQSNERIIMQQGLFMLPYIIDRDKHIELLNKNTDLIKIHKNLRNGLLEYLDSIGINSFRLMPDLASVCNAIKKMRKK